MYGIFADAFAAAGGVGAVRAVCPNETDAVTADKANMIRNFFTFLPRKLCRLVAAIFI